MHRDKTFRVPLVSLAEDELALADDVVGPPEVKHFGREEADAAVMVLGVVLVGEEDLAEAPRVLDRANAGGMRDVAFRERVVVGDVRPAVALGDVQIDQQLATGLERMACPRSACRVSMPDSTSCRATVSAMSCWASSALSRGAIIQPTT